MREKQEVYRKLTDKFAGDAARLKKRCNLVGVLRFVTMLALLVLLVYLIKTKDLWFLASAVAPLCLFIILLKYHNGIAHKKKLAETLAQINHDEGDFLSGKSNPFNDGSEYIDTRHAYTFDLDFFGKDSIFQNINRTASYIGRTRLAGLLRKRLPEKEIRMNQEAVKELSGNIDFRQRVNAFTRMADDSEGVFRKLLGWLKSGRSSQSGLLRLVSYASPVLLLAMIALFIVNGGMIFRTAFITLFFINLAILALNQKAIKKELISSGKIDEIFRNYSLVIGVIENEDFKSERLRQLQEKLCSNRVQASREIRKLSALFSQMDSMFNLIGAVLTNGLLLYHIHVLRMLKEWKIRNAAYVVDWLDVVGEFETLGSLANFSFNNPSFTFPELNEDYKMEFKDLGHPLIREDVRINNDVSFTDQRFIILTGSNMSGKSTFLRSLGVNMVLAGTGSPICASEADIHPMDVLVSMRVSDSLGENESYFLAEVNRLKEIMDSLSAGVSFVLLDEILRGTNSDDKHYGTVEVVKKLVSLKAFGAIATHDLKVCNTSAEYPDILVNKCFEVETIDNELSFDYQLREGICRNKSATFLMKKSGVI